MEVRPSTFHPQPTTAAITQLELWKRVDDVERTGILLAIVVALCWGSADTIATFAMRRQGTVVTTVVSLVTSVTVLVLFGSIVFASLSLSPAVFLQSAGLGLLTGIMAAVGYYSLYRGLELGPLAIVSPVTTADGAVGAVLAVLFLLAIKPA
jgi:drug/metabolite transporter (DMT)-like permease